MQYRVDPADAVRAVPLDSLTALFHRRSGQTHVVGDPIPDILAALGDVPVGSEVLSLRLAIADADREALVARLEELVATGLVSTG